MKIYSAAIENFRGIRSGQLVFPDHAVLIGDNNTGKSSVLEAIDLVLGPDRLSRRPPVDEHDFYQGRYLADSEQAIPEDAENLTVAAKDPKEATTDGPQIKVEVTITDLSMEQQARFGGHVEWLNASTGELYVEANPAGVDSADVAAALRVTFIGKYESDEE